MLIFLIIMYDPVFSISSFPEDPATRAEAFPVCSNPAQQALNDFSEGNISYVTKV